MTLPTSNISFSQIQTEFGGTNPIALSEYYNGGLYTTPNNPVSTSGAINVGSFSDGSYLPITAIYEDGFFTGTNSSIHIFNNNIGVADPTRELFIVITSGNNSNPSITSVYVGTTSTGSGGVSATIRGSTRYGLASIGWPTGTTAYMKVTFAATVEQISVSVFSVYNRRVYGGPILSTNILGTSYVSSQTLTKAYPIRAIGLVSAFTLAQGSSTPTVTLGSDYAKIDRYATSNFELYQAYLTSGAGAVRVTTAAATYSYAVTFNVVAALGGLLFIID